jgi:hypothetical protein
LAKCETDVVYGVASLCRCKFAGGWGSRG